MTLVDTNVWLALSLTGHGLHSEVSAWMADQRDPKSLAFCRATQQSFLRLLTTAAVFAPYGRTPLDNAAAWRFYSTIRSDHRVAWLDEPIGVEDKWRDCSGSAKPSPKVWMDAYLAAFATAAGIALVSTDTAFTNFPGLRSIVVAAP